ncbi:aminoacyl-tRNA deacylase [Microbacteriaceae bacterium 4G12]
MEKLDGILKESQFKFEILHHEKPLLSAQEGAEYLGIEVGQTAPSLIIKTDRGFFSLVISGSRGKVNFEKVADILGCSKVKLASKKEVQKITGYEVGTVPMVGLALPYVIDVQLFKYDFIYGGTGQPCVTLKIEPKALQALNQVVATFNE